jgi:hypothetical protein
LPVPPPSRFDSPRSKGFFLFLTARLTSVFFAILFVLSNLTFQRGFERRTFRYLPEKSGKARKALASRRFFLYINVKRRRSFGTSTRF